MADQDIKDIFNAAAGNDPIDQSKNDDQDLKAIFQQAHDNDPVKQSALESQQEPVSQLESGLRGAAQGATLGYSDEMMGALQALKHKALPEKGEEKASMEDLYKQYRDIQRSKNSAAQEQNPWTYGLGNVAGGVGSIALAPEAIAAKLGTIGGGAALGAATGLGTSDSEDLGGMAKDTALGAGLGAAGGALGAGIAKGVEALSPEALEVASSKMASKAVGIKPSKELARVYNQETGKVAQGSDIIKGIGKTAMDEGAMSLTGGANAIYDKSLEAIDNNYQKLNKIIPDVQSKLEQNMPDNLEEAGHIGDKTAKFLYDFREGLGTDPDQNAIMDKIEKKYIPYIEKLSASDGDLQQLISYKQGLQSKATDLASAAFDQPASDLKPEAEFVKRLSGIVRQHIEDLAETVDPQASEAIKSTNQTLSNLYTYNTAAKKLMDKGTGSAVASTLNLPSTLLTGNPIGREARMLAAKGLNIASKAVDTPAGQLVQKTLPATPASVITNPFGQAKIQSKFGSGDNPSSKIAKNLYNATDDSLKEVAAKIKQQPGLQFYADHLNKAIDNDDEGEKNRAIFLIMQNPLTRKLITPDKE